MKAVTTKTLIALGLIMSGDPALAGPQYASEESRQVIEAMVDAHGGIERWRAAPSIRFDNIMYNPYHEPDQFGWWIAHEVIDQKTRQVWQDWPMNDAAIGFDGDKVWSTNWKMGNPTPSMVHFFYYFMNLPWLTQDDGVQLSEVTRFDWPNLAEDLYRVEMRFDDAPDVGKSYKDFFVLYIDPESHRLVAYQYANGYQPLLDVMNMPEGKEVFGPLWRVITRYEEVDGLLFTTAWRTMPGPNERIVGNHVIMNVDVSQPFEHERAKMPAGADLFSGPLQTLRP